MAATRSHQLRGVVLLLALAGLLLAVTGSSRAALPQRTLLADQASLDLYPGSTTLGRKIDTEVDVYVPQSTEMARVVLYLPAGYGVDLAKAPGASVGIAVAFDPNGLGAIAKLTAADPSAYAATTCAPGPHQAVWLLEVGDGRLPVTPILVDPTSGADASLGALKAQLCLPPSSTGTMQVRLLALDLEVLTNPGAAGAYTWRAFVTPFAAGAPNDAGTFELRSTLPLPIHLTLTGKYDRPHKRAVLSGRLTAPAYDVGGTYLDLVTYRGGHWVFAAWVKVNARGAFTIRRKISKTTRFEVLTATWDDCAPGSPAPAGCISDTLATVWSPVAKVVVRRR